MLLKLENACYLKDKKMKKTILFFMTLFMLLGCKEEAAVKEPEKRIDKAVMVAIFYDLALLDASKYQMLSKTEYQKVTPKEFIFKKYKIDSVQFAQNNLYYASFVEEYKEMFQEVEKRLQVQSDKLDTLQKRKNDLLVKKGQKRSRKKEEELPQ